MHRLLLALLWIAAPALAQIPSQRLPSPGIEAFSQFGVAVDAGDGVLAVGATGTTAPGDTQGAVFVYRPSGVAEWEFQMRLVAPDVVGTGYVGASVDVSPDGQWLIAGAPLDATQGTGTGAAFVWRRGGPPGGWVFDAKLVATDAEAFDEFGQDVAIANTGEALVGAPFEGDGPTGGGRGAAYVFARGADGTWSQTAKLQPPDLPIGATFGRAVALDAGFAAVGTPVPGPVGIPQPPTDPGYVYVFARTGGAPTTWFQTQRLTGDDSVNGDFFGGAVDFVGNQMAVGANQDQDAGPVTGAVYVFEQGNVMWMQSAKLVPPEAEAQDGIGFSVAVTSSPRPRVIFSALGDDDGGPNAGAVYVWEREGAWVQRGKLLGTDADDRFGWSVGGVFQDVLVGAYGDSDAGFASGAAYVSWVPTPLSADGGPNAGPLRVGLPAPHPASGGARMAVSSIVAGEARVEIVDALGRRVANLGTRLLLPAAEASVVLPDLAPGVYVVIARQGDAVATRRVVVGR